MTQEGHRIELYVLPPKPVPFLLWGLLLCNVRCTEGSFLCLVRFYLRLLARMIRKFISRY
jgi:hypothetical protein